MINQIKMDKEIEISFDLILGIGITLEIILLLLGWIFPKLQLFYMSYPLILFPIPLILLLLTVFGPLYEKKQ